MNEHFTYAFQTELPTSAILDRLRGVSALSWKLEDTGDLVAAHPSGAALSISAAVARSGQRVLTIRLRSSEPTARETYYELLEVAFAVLLPAIERPPVTSDSPMLRIPGGKLLLGLTESEADKLAHELARAEITLLEEREEHHRTLEEAFSIRRNALRVSMPAHEVEVAEFYISRYPVTVDEYASYMAATGAAAPATWSLLRPPGRTFVTGVSWTEAAAYADFHGAALPTEIEWEHAARNGRSFFPWGDAYFPNGRLAFPDDQLDVPWVVGSRPQLASTHGVEDLIGSFGEFTSDVLAPYPEADPAWFEWRMRGRRAQRAVRGGYDVEQDSTTVFRNGIDEHERARDVKIRLVRRGATVDGGSTTR